jgi:hypothetical protein
MSTITPEVKSTQISSNQVRAGKRTYFFDVKSGPKGGLYLAISETAANDGVFTRNRMLIFDSNVRDFYEGLCEAIRSLREEQKKREVPAEPAGETKPARGRKAA